MSDMGATDDSGGKVTKGHFERTSDKPRDESIHEVTVSKITDLSPTVKKIVLTIAAAPNAVPAAVSAPSTFKAGQWVDLFVPGIPKIGGFTITSSPQKLRETGSLDLAIQYSEVQPAFWIHTNCQVGDTLSIRIGGDFYFDVSEDRGRTKALILLAGGVGINPLSSIINYVHGPRKLSAPPKIPTVLLYSAKNHQELIFRNEFDVLSAPPKSTLLCKYFLTADPTAIVDNVKTFHGRIDLGHINNAAKYILSNITGATLDNIKLYICGPPPMIHDMEQIAKQLKLTNIAYEKWW